MIQVCVNGVSIALETRASVFSPRGVDAGTRHMLTLCDFKSGQKVLDLGCGTGIVGIYAAKICGAENVLMSDISAEAVELAQKNALMNGVNVRARVSDGFRQIEDTNFDLILTNPPYQSDFEVAKHFIEKGFNRLVIGGSMLIVVKRRKWYENKLRSVFGGSIMHQIEGYHIFISQKRAASYANTLNP